MLANNLNKLKLKGVSFRPISYQPFYGTQQNRLMHGVQIYVSDLDKASLTLIQFYVLQECHKLWPEKNVFELCDPSRLSMFDKVCGTKKIREAFTRSFTVESIQDKWNEDVDSFKAKAKKYFFYN